MSNNTVIKLEKVGKQYRIGKERYHSLREDFTHIFRKKKRETIWALKDVSFEVKQGEVLGIIGRNGAGKTTILKLLAGITLPTEGKICLKGRVASLIEIGAGIHPELSGRENISLYASIMGLKKIEIAKKFDEIVDFAGIEKFLDTPVKYYSSGMRMRLGFSVAAHVQPDILLVDEVLAVGDATFQKKCLGKMDGVAKSGRTVVFVSHNMAAITRICQRTILLDEGHSVQDGPSHQIINVYLQSGSGIATIRKWQNITKAPGNDIVRLRATRVCTKDRQTAEVVDIQQPVGIEIEYEVLKAGYVLIPNYHFFNETGIYVFTVSEVNTTWYRRPRPIGRYVSTVWIPGNFLSEGSLIVGVAISTMNPVTVHFYERDAVAFRVVDSMEGNSARGDYTGPIPGVIRPLLHWTTEFNPVKSEVHIERNRGVKS